MTPHEEKDSEKTDKEFSSKERDRIIKFLKKKLKVDHFVIALCRNHTHFVMYGESLEHVAELLAEVRIPQEKDVEYIK